jgi:2-oxoglutarate dehydrogenase E1 component
VSWAHAVHVPFVTSVRYRRQGHNELDQALFTQPIMYKKIPKHPTALSLYKSKLISEGSLTPKEVDEVQVSQDAES